MPRKRLVSPEFFTHGGLFDAEQAAGLPLRLAFAGLWTVCDRRGLFRWKPRELKLTILPYDALDFAAVLDALAAAGFIERYVVDGKEYGRVPSFGTWQTFHRNELASDVPEPSTGVPAPADGAPESTNGRRQSTKLGRNLPVVITGTGTVASTGTSEPPAADASRRVAEVAFDALWPRYPSRAGGNTRKSARKAFLARTAAGVSLDELAAGVERYAVYIRATGKERTEFVLQGATFFGPDEHWREPWDVPLVTVSRGGGAAIGVAPEVLGQAATLFARYQTHNLLTKWQRPEYERIGALLVAEGCYPSLAAFLDELRVTKPWDLGDSRTDGHAINELAKRLQGRKAA